MDDDAGASPSPSPSPSRSPSPLPVADPVTVAAAPPGHVAVAIPLSKPSPSSGGGGGGREDAWSDGATSALIDAWGERFVALGRGSLRHPQWQEVAEVVSSRDGYSKAPKSDVQCKNRIDTLKKKYKVEKARHDSSWPFFDRLDDLLAPVYKPGSGSSSAARSAPPMVPPRFSFPQRTRTPLQPSAGVKRRMPSPPPQPSASSDSSDGFPPEPPLPLATVANGKRQRVEEPTPANGAESSSDRAQGLRELAQAIRRLGEVYERVEGTKREQELRMERERLEAARDLEDQRVQFFLKMQMELSKASGGAASATPMAVATAVDGNGSRRTAMATDVGTTSNHKVRYRIKDSRHRHSAPQSHYQYSQSNASTAAPASGKDSDSDNKEDEDMEEADEESQ